MREKAVVVSSQNLPKMCESFHSPFQNSLFLTLPMLTLTFGWNISIKIGTLTLEVKIINPSMMAAAAGWNLPIHFYSGRMRKKRAEAGHLCAASCASSTSLSCFLLLVLQEAALVSSTRLNITGSPPPTIGSLGVTGHGSWAAALELEWEWCLGTCFVQCYLVCLLLFESRYLRIKLVLIDHWKGGYASFLTFCYNFDFDDT